MAGIGITLTRTDIGSILTTISKQEPSLLDTVENIMYELKSLNDGSTFRMPGLGITHGRYQRMFMNATQDRKDTSEMFWNLLDKLVTIRSSSRGNVVVDFYEDIPIDFKPCLITDASARVKSTYQYHPQYRNDMVFLKKATKLYTNLVCHLINLSSGKEAYRNPEKFKVLVETITRIINSKPDEQFLVIHLKSNDIYGRDDITKKIPKKALNPERVSFLSYGYHTATNDYQHIPNIILCGIPFYEEAAYEAIGRAAANRPTSKGEFCKEDIHYIKSGEHQHHILQSACRGIIRKCINNTCPNADLYVIAHQNTGINEDLLKSVFPKCKVILETELTDMQKLALDFIVSKLSAGADTIYLKELLRITGKRNNSTFLRDIYKNSFKQAMNDLGLIIVGNGAERRFIKGIMMQDEEMT